MEGLVTAAAQLEAQLRRIVDRDFRAWSVANWRPVGAGIEFLVVGGTSPVVGDVVFRIPWQRWIDNDNDADLDTRRLLGQECAIAAYVGKRGLPAPRPITLHCGDDGDPDFLVSEYVRGDGSPSDGVAFGRLMAALHGLTALELATAMCDRASTNQTVAARITKRLRALAALTGDVLVAPSEAALLAVLDACCTRRRILHMDARDANLLTRGGAIAGIVDWSNCLIGDPLLELGRIAEYGGLTDAFRLGYDAPAELARLDAPEGLICRLDTAVVLTLLFTSQIPDPVRAAAHRARVHELLGLLR